MSDRDQSAFQAIRDRLRNTPELELVERLFKGIEPSSYGRAWYAQHSSAAERFHYRTMSIRDLVNKAWQVALDDWELLSVVIELDRRARDAGYGAIHEWILDAIYSDLKRAHR
jgi:hypothetical protein